VDAPDATADVGGVRLRIEAACARAGRAPSDVLLVGVSKLQPLERVRAVVAAGVRDLGENHAQALTARAADLGDLVPAVRWHFIGPLQRNKARLVAEHASAFHALDRVEVAEALAARRREHDPLPVYVQVNLAAEPSKAGVAAADLGPLIDAVRELPALRVVGLRTMPPLARRPDDNRRWFAELRELALAHELTGLSMGTTDDFEVAVEEGATAVRVGRVLFGERPPG
jgi:pyridoxal phosphate enzyme (YggS family)